jgi:hypothetical protein
MKRRIAYITAAWGSDDVENTELAAQYCRAVYEAGYSPICPSLFLPLFLNDEIPKEHKDAVDMAREHLRRAHLLVVIRKGRATEEMKSDIAIAERLGITATSLRGLQDVKLQGREQNA